MRSVTPILLLSYVAFADARERVANPIGDVQASMDKSADKSTRHSMDKLTNKFAENLFHRVGSPFHHADLDDTTLGKTHPDMSPGIPYASRTAPFAAHAPVYSPPFGYQLQSRRKMAPGDMQVVNSEPEETMTEAYARIREQRKNKYGVDVKRDYTDKRYVSTEDSEEPNVPVLPIVLAFLALLVFVIVQVVTAG